jgi:hypothetical protein
MNQTLTSFCENRYNALYNDKYICNMKKEQVCYSPSAVIESQKRGASKGWKKL